MRFHTAVNSFCFSAAINEEIKVYKTALNQYRPYLSLSDAFRAFQILYRKKFFQK
jgi:UDP-glucose 4-epimerase